MNDSRLSDFSIRNIISEMNLNRDKAVDLDEVLKNNNIRLRESKLGNDRKGNPILGACKSVGLNKLIVVSPSISYETRKRFTIAHEIGHLFLHYEKNLFCIATDFDVWQDKHTKETEANIFASELLLPQVAVISSIKRGDIDFEMVDELVNRYNVSVIATAIRLIKCDSGRSAFIVHDGKKTERIIKSASCRNNIQLTSSDWTFSGETITRKVDPSIWLSGKTDGWTCSEETRYLTRLGKYHTILNIYYEK